VQFHPLAYLVKLHIEIVMTELIVKIVRFSESNWGTEQSHNTSSEYIPDTAVRRLSTKKAELCVTSIGSNRATYNTSVSAEDGQRPFPAKASLFGIEKIVECDVKAEVSENTIQHIDVEAQGRS
jgi:hypothetical protein